MTVNKGIVAAFNFSLLLVVFFIIGRVYSTESLLLRPRDISYLPGIAASSLLHESWPHLVYNIIGLLLFLFFLIKEKEIDRPILDIAVIVLLSNTLLFLIGNDHYYYLGASNIIYGLVGYSIGSVVLNRKWLLTIPLILLSVQLVSGLSFSSSAISYTSHYLGLIVGLFYNVYRYLKLNTYVRK